MKKSALKTLIREIVETVILNEGHYKTEYSTEIHREVDLDKFPDAEEDMITIPIFCKLSVYTGTNNFDDPTEINFISVVNSKTGEPIELTEDERDDIASEFLSYDDSLHGDHEYERHRDMEDDHREHGED